MINDVGSRMLVLRKLNGWSQRSLAKRAGVPHSAISMIEHGQVSPSVNSLKKVLDGVPMSLADFFSLDVNEDSRAFYKADSLKSEPFGDIVRTSLRTSPKDNNGIVVTREEFLAGSDTGEEMISGTGFQAGFVVRGQLEVTVGGEVEQLKVGDAFYFNRRRPYRFRNLTNDNSETVSAILSNDIS